MNERVVVAMSGGVDSSVAALLLAEQGYEALGVSMQVWDYRQHGVCEGKAACCAPEDFSDARKVAAKVGIPYYVFDFEATFRREVIERFVATYKAGRTPNPCIDCNQRVKFKELRERAESLGAAYVATGHYAQIERREDGFHLLRGNDPQKDQSYFLYGLGQPELAKTLFPVGAMTKNEVREIARANGLATAEKSESQDICFVTHGLDEFLEKMGCEPRSGELVSIGGVKLGEHQGVHRFTVGQRRGIGVGGNSEPLYVVGIEPEENRILVGPRSALERDAFLVNELKWSAPRFCAGAAQPGLKFECLAQLRYRHRGVKAQAEILNDGTARVSFIDSWSTVAPGQACVFYDLENKEVLGGGRILE